MSLSRRASHLRAIALAVFKGNDAAVRGRLSDDAAWLLISNIGGAALSFALTAVLARALGSEGLGMYAVALAWIAPIAQFVDFGIGSLMTRDLAAHPEQSDSFLHTGAAARLLLGGVTVALLILFAPRLSESPIIRTGILIAAPMVIIVPFYSLFTPIFKARGAMWAIPPLNLGMLIGQVVLTVIVLAAGGGVLAALIINTVTSLGQLIAAWALYRRRFFVRAPINPQRLIPLFRRALPFAFAAVFAVLQARLAIILIERLDGSEGAGLFTAANRLVEAARMIPNAWFGALFPALAALAADPTRLEATFSRTMRGLGRFGILTFAVSVIVAPFVIPMLFGTAFAPAAPIFIILMGGFALNGLRGAKTLYAYARHREGWVNAVNFAVVGVQVALSLALIPAMGANGAAWALLISEAFALALLWRSPVEHPLR